MGRLPAQWGSRVIMDRLPYEMPGELIMTSAQTAVQFPESTFANNIDKPFEIHRMIPRIYALDSSNVLLDTQPDQELLAGLVRIRIIDLGLDYQATKASTLIGTLTKGSSERTWEWADPHYLTKGNQLQITLDTLTYPAITNLNSLRVALTFEGFLLVVAPPSENR